ncbi:MAG: sulfite dehydrogenase [Woeseia sp.]|nr:sulfite dehydrogenase [Woeseia sp.]
MKKYSKADEPHAGDQVESKDIGESATYRSSSASENARTLTRRTAIARAAQIGGIAILGNVSDATAQTHSEVLPLVDKLTDTSKTLGTPGTVLGSRSSHAKVRRFLRSGRPWTSGTPHEELLGTLTPADLHFERHHAGVPQIDPSEYALLIHGMVERPTVFSLSDLQRHQSVTAVHFLECSGHYPGNPPAETRPSRIAPLLSNSEWTGVPLRTLLEEVGMHADARWLLAEGQDGSKLTRSIPIEKAWDDAMIAYGQNGESLRPAQGYPARLFNPGWEGNTCVKWLRRIEVTDRPVMSREETSRYTDATGSGEFRQFSFVMHARSLITHPGYPEKIKPGFVDIQGIAWSGRGRISKVEVTIDDGRTWQVAQLQMPVLSKAFTRFQLPWQWDGTPTTIWSRATDETGYVQPTMTEFKRSRGAMGYHENFTIGWTIKPDGNVVFRVQDWDAA